MMFHMISGVNIILGTKEYSLTGGQPPLVSALGWGRLLLRVETKKWREDDVMKLER